MLPLVDKPAIQYGVEEAVTSGLEEFDAVVGRTAPTESLKRSSSNLNDREG